MASHLESARKPGDLLLILAPLNVNEISFTSQHPDRAQKIRAISFWMHNSSFSAYLVTFFQPIILYLELYFYAQNGSFQRRQELLRSSSVPAAYSSLKLIINPLFMTP